MFTTIVSTTTASTTTTKAANAVRNAVYTAAVEAFELNKGNAEFAPYAAGMAAYEAAYFIFRNAEAAANYAAPIAANAMYDITETYDTAWNAVYEWKETTEKNNRW